MKNLCRAERAVDGILLPGGAEHMTDAWKIGRVAGSAAQRGTGGRTDITGVIIRSHANHAGI